MKIQKFSSKLLAWLITAIMLVQFVPMSAQASPEDTGDLIILQSYGGGKAQSKTPISHSFVEVYNPTEAPIDLLGWKIVYHDDRNASPVDWEVTLSDSSLLLESRSSFLIRGQALTELVDPAYNIEVYDLDLPDNWLDNKTYSVKLYNSQDELVNEITNLNVPNKHTSLRRVNFTSEGFEEIDYRTSSGMTDEKLALLRPRSMADGQWGELGGVMLPSDQEIVLSAAPGVYDSEFDMTVSVPSCPEAVVYWSIDGSEPTPGDDKFLTRGDVTHQLTGSFVQGGEIAVRDRSGQWEESILTYYSPQFHSWQTPLPGTTTLQGTSFRFRAYVGDDPVSETVTASYIIAPNAAERFNNCPIISITAEHDDFYYVYANADPFDGVTQRRDFQYEYFDLLSGSYSRVFNLPGSTQLGGTGSRGMAQRTFNVHFARGSLDGVVDYPVFSDLNELYRLRLWNGGNSFEWDHMRDLFAQSVSEGLNVTTADYKVAIMFINGEFWGFTIMREHTSNAEFVSTRYNMPQNNVAIIDRGWEFNPDGSLRFFDTVEDGNESSVMELYNEVVEFATTHDMSTDAAREQLFSKYFDQDNFMDYLIANTFFNNSDWPHNNMRFFRAITPNPDSGNKYEDGKWRFMLHDMDWAPFPGAEQLSGERFSTLYDRFGIAPEFNDIFLVFNNKTFVKQFVERALDVLEKFYTVEQMTAVHNDLISTFRPLIPEMYNRFNIAGGQDPLLRFDGYTSDLRNFINNRKPYYLQQLNNLLIRVSLAYCVSYNANGGSGEPAAQQKLEGVPIVLTADVPVRADYIFIGWGTTAEATVVEYKPGDSYTTDSNVTLYALWQPVNKGFWQTIKDFFTRVIDFFRSLFTFDFI